MSRTLYVVFGVRAFAETVAETVPFDGALMTAKPKPRSWPLSTPDPSQNALPSGPSSGNFPDPPPPAAATPAVIPATTNVARKSLRAPAILSPPFVFGRAPLPPGRPSLVHFVARSQGRPTPPRGPYSSPNSPGSSTEPSGSSPA